MTLGWTILAWTVGPVVAWAWLTVFAHVMELLLDHLCKWLERRHRARKDHP